VANANKPRIAVNLLHLGMVGLGGHPEGIGWKVVELR